MTRVRRRFAAHSAGSVHLPQILLLSVAVVLAPQLSMVGVGLHDVIVNDARPAALSTVGGKSEAATTSAASRVGRAAAKATAEAAPTYRRLPAQRIAWTQSSLANPVQDIWIYELRRFETAGSSRATLSATTRRDLGPNLSDFVEDLMTDIASVAGRDDIANAKTNASSKAALFAQAGGAALFDVRHESFHVPDLLKKALGKSPSPEESELAKKLEILWLAHRKPEFSLEDVRYLGRLGDDADAATLDQVLRQLNDEIGFEGPPTERELRSRFGEHVEFFEHRFPAVEFEVLADDYFTRSLPKPGSDDWRELVRNAKTALRQDGYAIVPTGKYFEPGHGHGLIDRYPEIKGVQITEAGDNGDWTRLRRYEGKDAKVGAMAALMPAGNALRVWQEGFLADVLGQGVDAPIAQLELIHGGERQLVEASTKNASGRRITTDSAHVDAAEIAMSTVFDGPHTVLYPTLRGYETASSAAPVDVSRVQAGSGDMAIFFGQRAEDAPALADWKPFALVHGSPAQKKKRLWIGLAARVPDEAVH